MADHPKDKPVKPRLQSVPGWAEDNRARPQAEKPPPPKQPEQTQPEQTKAEPPRASKPAPKTETQPQPAPAAPTTKQAAEQTAKTQARPAEHTTQRLKPSVPAFKWPTIDLSAIKWPSLKLPSVKLPSLKAPSLPHLNKRALTGAAAALAGVSLALLFARYAGNDNEAPVAPDAQKPVAEVITPTQPKPETAAPVAAAPKTAAPQTESPQTESSKAEAAKKQDNLSTIAHLPQPGAATEQDIKRLMQDSKLPRDVIEEALHIYNHATPDKYRGQPEDKLEVVYSQGLDVLFARVHANNTVRDIYGFEDRFGNFGFYSEDGHRVDRTGLSSPLKNNDINNPKLTRVFDTYRHPIHKVKRHHSGIDFPATRGTPIYAVADGVVEYAKRRSGYGNTVTLNHNGNMQSLYAHLDGFADIKAGRRVQQGELIGYVGSTGWSTGPHLHFEIRKNGTPINPRTITAFSAPMVSPQDRSEFANVITRIKNHLASDASPATPAHTKEAPAFNTPLSETFKDLFHRPGDDKIKTLIVEAAQRDGIHPDLPYRLFIKEAGVNGNGNLRTAARSDTGASGLCQFTEQTFLYVMKSHGERLGMGQYANKIRSYIGEDRATYYTADGETRKILDLRAEKKIAIPLCTAYMRDNINHLKAKLGRPPNFTDVSIAHFFGPGIAADIIPAYDNPRTRKQYAYKFARSETLTGETNQSVFFRGGDRKQPYTVEQVYHMKREKMGTEPALITDIKRDRNSDLAAFQPR